MDDEDLVDLVASGEDTTLPCSSPEASLVAPPQFQDDPADDDDDAKSTATSYDSSDYHHQDDSRLQLLNDKWRQLFDQVNSGAGTSDPFRRAQRRLKDLRFHCSSMSKRQI